MTRSVAMSGEGPRIPHHAKEGSELFDLRDDLDDSFERVETPTVLVKVTAALLKAARAAPVPLVPAAGVDTIVEFLGIFLRLNPGSEVFTEVADNLAVRYTDGTGALVTADIEMTGFVDASGNTSISAVPNNALIAGNGAINAALVLHNTGDAEIAGNATEDGSVDAYVRYRIHKNVPST